VAEPPFANTHVHLPPNFSAFETVEDAVATAAAEGLRVIGSSNFHDFGVYPRFRDAAREAGVMALFGCEIISLLPGAEADGTRVNDPDNPGRAYLCGKGIPAPDRPGPEAQRMLATSHAMNDARTTEMVGRMRDHLAAAGLAADISASTVAADVAARAGVPPAWVVLQERHVAEAFQALLFERCEPSARRAVLERAFRGGPGVDVEDPMAVQAALRSRLMKAGGAAFVPESPVPFDDALALVLALEAIPCYPTLADGAQPVCEFEDPPTALADRILERGIHAAELIPIRNRPEVVEAYVRAWRDAGIVVMAGTEHNTKARIPLEVRCVDGSRPAPHVLEAFAEGTCVVAAHQHQVAAGHHGYVDREGHLDPGFPDGETRIRWYRELGAQLIAEQTGAVPA
jgi:hypothetical protein